MSESQESGRSRGFFDRVTEPVGSWVRTEVDKIEDKVRAAIAAQTAKIQQAIQEKVAEYAPSVASFVIGALLALFALGALVAAAILGLSVWLHPALSAVIVAAVLLLAAWALVAYGRKSLPRSSPPHTTTTSRPEQDETVDHFWTD